jgi:hypothetical protein
MILEAVVPGMNTDLPTGARGNPAAGFRHGTIAPYNTEDP